MGKPIKPSKNLVYCYACKQTLVSSLTDVETASARKSRSKFHSSLAYSQPSSFMLKKNKCCEGMQ